jgi:hypothetical protein
MSGTYGKVLVLQRESLVAPGVPSLSVSARIVEVLDYLESKGEVEYTSISDDGPCVRRAIKWADTLVFSKHRSARAFELAKLAKNFGKKIIYDIDDWIFSFPRYSGGLNTTGSVFSEKIIRIADAVTVANTELMQRVPVVMPGISPVLLPNGMWVERYQSLCNDAAVACEKRIVFTNADFLKVQNSKNAILTALNVFFMRHPDFVLDFYGDPFPEMFSLPFLHFANRMQYQDYMRAIVSGRYMFSITPLGAEEDQISCEFNACKNPFKYINYGVAKIPGIYSSAKIYRDCVTSNKTGLLVDNNYESWLSAMEHYASRPDLRETVRRAAYDHILRDFHVNASADVFVDILNQLHRGTQKSRAMGIAGM